MKSVLIVCNRIPYPLKDGGALAMFSLLKAWQEQGKEVHLLAMNTSRHFVPFESFPAFFEQLASFNAVFTDTDIRPIGILANLAFSKLPEHADRFYSRRFEAKLIELLQQIKPDVVQLESIYLQTYVPAIRKHSEALVVQRLHNIESEIWSRLAKETARPLKAWYLRNLSARLQRFEKAVWRSSDALLPITRQDATYIERSGVDTPMMVMPYGINIQAQKNTEHNWNNIEAYHIGAMDWKPNVEAMLRMRDEIVPAIIKAVPGFTFSFAGRNMPEVFLKETQAAFRCHGEVADAAAFIEDKQVLIVPLLSGSGMRIKTLEAMAAGKLVVSTDVGVQGIDALDKIHFLRANTANDFAAAMKWISENPRAAAKIADNAKDLPAAHHDLSKLMPKADKFLSALIAEKHQ